MMKKPFYEIALVEDDELMLEFLESAINSTQHLNCIEKYSSAEQALDKLPKSSVDLVIMDIRLPGESGIECLSKVKALRPDIQFMMYTMFDEGDKIFDSLKAGASGYLLKSDKLSTQEDTIIEAIEEILSGGAPMSSSIARKITDFFFNPRESIQELDLLSKREIEVLEELSKGLLYKEIAEKLGIKIGTIKQHIHKIYQKLHVQNRTEAINIYLGRKKENTAGSNFS